MIVKFLESLEVPPAFKKAIGHFAGGFGALFFGTGLILLGSDLVRFFKSGFESFDVKIGAGDILILLMLIIGGSLMFTAKKIVDEAKREAMNEKEN